MYVDYLKKTLRINLVYYGPPFGGKSTSIAKVLELTSHDLTSPKPIYFYGLDAERGICGEYIPERKTPCPLQIIFNLTALPGYSGYVYDKAHKMLLSRADGILFIADSQKERIQESEAYLGVLRKRIRELFHQDWLEFPFVLQWNKADTDNSMPIETSKISSLMPESQIYKTCAIDGKGILEAMNHCISLISKHKQIDWICNK